MTRGPIDGTSAIALVRQLPGHAYDAVLARLPEPSQRRLLAGARGPLDDLLAHELRRGDPHRLAALASNPELTPAAQRRLAALCVPAVDDALFSRPHVEADVRAATLARTTLDPTPLLHELRDRSPDRLRPFLTAGDPDVVGRALAWVDLPDPVRDRAFLSGVLSLWRTRGLDVVRATLAERPRHVNSTRLLQRYLNAPDGPDRLERRIAELGGSGELVTRLRRSSPRHPARVALDGATADDWDALLRAHRADPFDARVRLALLGRPDCPHEAVPELLHGLLRFNHDLLTAMRAGVLTAADIVRHATRGWALLKYIDRTVEPTGQAPWVGSSHPLLYALLDLRLADLVGDDPDAWVRLLRIGPRFFGTIAELGRAARESPPQAPPRTELWTRGHGSAGALILTLAPPPIAVAVVSRIEPRELNAVLYNRYSNLQPDAVAVAAPGMPAQFLRSPPTALLRCPELRSRQDCLASLDRRPLDLADTSQPGARWIWPALGTRLVDARDLIARGRPAAAVLEILERSRTTVPETHAAGTAAIRALVAGPLSSPRAAETWAIAVALLADFSGTVPELLATARAAGRTPDDREDPVARRA
ncbi:hypothetical protein [Embleya sp. NBC_00896]|uniref:hypothetical protein n=1 Tax=Embleya sp. NBC_00896 TaxID=2975961 RepID=UPI002F911F4B|nr:hypothetical protein OG928_41895 [Embleya sp. NBC_00896]